MKQLQLLRYTINNPDWFDKVQPELFNPDNRLIFNIAHDIHKQGLIPTEQSIIYIQPSLTEKVTDVFKQNQLDETTFLLIKEELRLIAVNEFIQELSLLYMQQPDQKTLQSNTELLNRLLLSEIPETVGLGTDFFNLLEHIQIEGHSLSSGLQFLADTGSEPEKGQLMTFMAPSNNGKSTIMGDMCRKMFAKGYNVLYFAFEETTADFMLRIGRGMLKKTQHEYQNYAIEDLQRKWNGAEDKVGRLTVVTGVSVSAESIQSVIEENEAKYETTYDAIFIDYSSHIQLLNQNKSNRDDQVISKIFRSLKQIANTKGNEKLIVTAVQANREGYRGTLGAQNAADSLGSIRESDLVMGIRMKNITSAEIVTPENDYPERLQGIFEINTIKRRKGTLPVGSKFYYEFKADNNIYKIDNETVTAQLETQWEDVNLSEDYLNELNNPLGI